MADDLSSTEKEVWRTLKPVTLSMNFLGMSLNDNQNPSLSRFLRLLSFSSFSYMLCCLIAHPIRLSLDRSRASVAAFASCLFVIGYGVMCYTKYIQLQRKQPMFKKLIKELIELWPVTSVNEEAEEIKEKSIRALLLSNYWYMLVNISGGFIFNATPIAIYIYKTLRGIPADLGFGFFTDYPYDKTKPIYHEVTILFELYTATFVGAPTQISSDMLFTSMASHMTLLLRLLQLKIRRLGMSQHVYHGLVDCYDDIISTIKIHQKLIRFINEIEDHFSMVNLINCLLSAINICCALFHMVFLEPWNVLTSKIFVASALMQMGVICYYADEICKASLEVADSVFESGWYRCNQRCRRALLILMIRVQKPICFTAMKFENITFKTYSTILTTSYSYFTLLYTMYLK